MNTPRPDKHNEHTTPCDAFREDLEGYALGALEADEQFRVETHLDACASCQNELTDIRAVTDFLPFASEPADPSPEVKTALMSRIVADRNTPHPGTKHPGNPWQPAPETESNDDSPEGTRLSAWQRWIAPGLVAPLAIALIVLSAWTNSLQNEVDELRAGNAVSQQVNANGVPGYDLQLYDFKPACPECEEKQASGQLGGNPNSSVGVVVVWDLDPNEKHQVWCINKQGEKLLISDLDVEHSGNVFQTIAFPQELGGYEQIYVARHDGSTDPDAELLVAMTEEHEAEYDLVSPDPEPDSN